jgi:hypothetical protein
MTLIRVTHHQASFSLPQRLEPPLLVIRNSASMSFSASNFTMDCKTYPMMATNKRALSRSLWNQTVRKKMGMPDQIPPVKQSPCILPKGVHRRSLSEHNTLASQIDGTSIRQIIILVRVGTLGPPPYSQDQQPMYPIPKDIGNTSWWIQAWSCLDNWPHRMCKVTLEKQLFYCLILTAKNTCITPMPIPLNKIIFSKNNPPM